MTFSITAYCPESGQHGMAISSSSPAVAARCVHTRGGVGVVASQNVTDPSLGPLLLSKLADGHSASDAINSILANTQYLEYRQLLVVDSSGLSATYSGQNALGNWTASTIDHAAAGGNLLDNTGVPDVMLQCFSESAGSLAERLMQSLEAGLAAGGEAGPVHSAGLQVAESKVSWPVVDLRCDWTKDCPILELRNTWEIYQPQLEDYITRAINPTAAPSYNVPGDG